MRLNYHSPNLLLAFQSSVLIKKVNLHGDNYPVKRFNQIILHLKNTKIVTIQYTSSTRISHQDKLVEDLAFFVGFLLFFKTFFSAI